MLWVGKSYSVGIKFYKIGLIESFPNFSFLSQNPITKSHQVSQWSFFTRSKDVAIGFINNLTSSEQSLFTLDCDWYKVDQTVVAN